MRIIASEWDPKTGRDVNSDDTGTVTQVIAINSKRMDYYKA